MRWIDKLVDKPWKATVAWLLIIVAAALVEGL